MSKYQLGCPLHRVDLGGIAVQPSFRPEELGVLAEDISPTEHGPGIVRNAGPAWHKFPVDGVAAGGHFLGY